MGSHLCWSSHKLEHARTHSCFVHVLMQASGGNLLRAGRSAAFSVNSPLSTGESEEAVAVVAELRNPLPSSECATLCSKIKQACWQEQGVQPVAVLLCKVKERVHTHMSCEAKTFEAVAGIYIMCRLC